MHKHDPASPLKTTKLTVLVTADATFDFSDFPTLKELERLFKGYKTTRLQHHHLIDLEVIDVEAPRG